MIEANKSPLYKTQFLNSTQHLFKFIQLFVSLFIPEPLDN